MTPPPTPLPELGDVPRTMLWTLHCRAHAAERGAIDDPEALRLARALGPELRRTFGRPDPCFAARARLFDAAVQAFLTRHEGATVVSLGEGLETMRHRVTGYGRWITVDLPEVIAVRDHFLRTDATHRHVAASATELTWTEWLDGPSYVVAQGLLMYLDERSVREILRAFASRARAQGGGAMMFDVIPGWLATFSRLRAPMTPRFRIPRMRWGAGRAELERLLREVVGEPHQARWARWTLPSGPLAAAPLAEALGWRTWVVEVEVPGQDPPVVPRPPG